MKLCPACGEVVPENEAAAFGGRHEDCWTAASADIDETRRAEIWVFADAAERSAEVRDILRNAHDRMGIDETYLEDK